ncbi:helix-turn-helix transcriptional regulator [Aerococcaceae bacterium zg-ZJ1578]|uniref:helix-turn-helix domain-containing protein n=1 Tax=Aerococcaceae bacterium zg-252 TaxID=2796928 RepID=UPI001A2C7C89|nr:helix-turn-helix transcriptional regulator [Aerococcaceae bacterium zg-1578]
MIFCAFFAFLSNKKLEYAQKLLHNTQVSIAEISEYLSFTSPSYFISKFKHAYGKTPNQYRNSLSV